MCADLLEGVQMDVDGDLSSQFVRQVLQHLPLIHRFLIGPKEVKPLDHSLLQVLSYLEAAQKGGGGVKVQTYGSMIETPY